MLANLYKIALLLLSAKDGNNYFNAVMIRNAFTGIWQAIILLRLPANFQRNAQ